MGELLERMTSEELTGWIAYFDLVADEERLEAARMEAAARARRMAGGS